MIGIMYMRKLEKVLINQIQKTIWLDHMFWTEL